MNKKLSFIIALILIAPGCAKINSTGISFAKTDAQRLFIWKSNYSAGMGTNSGICAQGALTAFATSADFSANLPKQIPPTDIGYKQTQAIARINSSNNQTAYANISFFYLCQIMLNSMKKTTTESIGSDGKTKDIITVIEPSISTDKILEMWKSSNQTATLISQNSEGLGAFVSPNLNVNDKESDSAGSAQADSDTTQKATEENPKL
jgi:hypothetical protein